MPGTLGELLRDPKAIYGSVKEVGLGHDETMNDNTVQACSLIPEPPYGPSLGGAGQVKGYLAAQDDPENSVPLEASLPREHRVWSRPDPVAPMQMEEAALELPEAGLSRTPCRKRKAGQTGSPSPCKRPRGRSTRHKVSVRLVEVVSKITPDDQHFCWDRRRALWCGHLGQETWGSEDLSTYVLAGMPFLSLIMRPGGYGFPVPLVWDGKAQRFSHESKMDAYNWL